MTSKYEVWKTVPSNRHLDNYYTVVTKGYAHKLIIEMGDELIKTGFKSYEEAIDFINILTKLKGETK